MIIGIGTDLCDIRRIERTIEKFGDRFLNKIFTHSERQYCDAKSGRAAYYAKRFAAKEAAAKALSGPETGALSWHDVEIGNDPSGRPSIQLKKGAKARIESLVAPDLSSRIHLSLTDDYPYAMAYVIVEAVAPDTLALKSKPE